MSDFIFLSDYPEYMEIKTGDIIFISSDARKMMWDAVSNGQKADLNDFIDALLAAVGDSGTVIFPTYNWDFCSGFTFDIINSPCQTGSLGSVALKRGDFRRTKHPIYSFAVKGSMADELLAMNNRDAFGEDSPFAYFRNNSVINYIIDVTLQHCFTFAHYVEEQSAMVSYRYIKNFTAGYIDKDGCYSNQTYSMYVRDLEFDVVTTIDPIEEDFIREGIENVFSVNSSNIKKINLNGAYDLIMKDIIENRSRKICKYKGQDEVL